MFAQFAKILGASDIKLEIAMNAKDGIMAITIVPVNLRPGMDAIRPLQLSGTPDELDAGFFGKIDETLSDIISMNDNIQDVKKDLKKAKLAEKANTSTPEKDDDDDETEKGDDTDKEQKTPEEEKKPDPPKKLTKAELKKQEEEKKKLDYQAKVKALESDMFAEQPIVPKEEVVIPEVHQPREQIQVPKDPIRKILEAKVSGELTEDSKPADAVPPPQPVQNPTPPEVSDDW